MSRIPAGRFRHRVRIEEPNVVDNGRGGRMAVPGEDKWRTVADRVPAEVIALRGTVAIEHLVQQQKQLYRVTVRRRAPLTIEQQLVWGVVVMSVKSCAPNDAGDALVMTCESVVRG